jgi:hypothetical protein
VENEKHQRGRRKAEERCRRWRKRRLEKVKNKK